MLVCKITQEMKLKKAVFVAFCIQIFWVYWSRNYWTKMLHLDKKLIETASMTSLNIPNEPILSPTTSMGSLKPTQRHLRIACIGTEHSILFDSYYMRCTQLIFFAKLYMKDIYIKPLTYEKALKVKNSFDGAIFIKTTPDLKMWPKLWKTFKKIYVDVIDGPLDNMIDFDHLKLQSPPPVLIVQNVYQEKLYNDTFKTVIIEHMPASLNSSDWVDVETLRHPLQALSAMSHDGHSSTSGLCKEIQTSSVILKCVDTMNKKKVLKNELNVSYDKYKSKTWGVPWLFTQLFRKYDVLVVYTKKGMKTTINSVQRMTNSIHSGVITVIERTGLHALYVSKSYPCSFTNHAELEKVLEELDKNVFMRKLCQQQAKVINNLFDPKTIMRKYEDMLRSDL